MEQQVATQKGTTVKSLLSNPAIKARFEEMLKDKAAGFISSVINIVNNSSYLASAEPNSVIAAAAVAATLDLPINSSLGFAHIVPYKSKGVQVAQFQMGWRGYVQLALRTGQYVRLNCTEIFASQLKSFNPVTGDYVWDFASPATGPVIGYASYFKLVSGFEKTVYWNVGKITDHGKKYSKSFNNSDSQWQSNYDAMARKTLIKHIISNWGIMSIEMRTAIQTDDAVVKVSENAEISAEYVDNPNDYQAANVVSSTVPDPKQDSNVEASRLNNLNL